MVRARTRFAQPQRAEQREIWQESGTQHIGNEEAKGKLTGKGGHTPDGVAETISANKVQQRARITQESGSLIMTTQPHGNPLPHGTALTQNKTCLVQCVPRSWIYFRHGLTISMPLAEGGHKNACQIDTLCLGASNQIYDTFAPIGPPEQRPIPCKCSGRGTRSAISALAYRSAVGTEIWGD